ncbi:universal stress protein [Amycolatopsis sp. GM8]|uniref:universal stress protein n=1 Tax=Amycolatopsis sp. GM8 TaxID=2896530 RepID=UPI001F3C21C8|nr:universal stress protein [Amycolatopsis sp. GM8]
MAAGPIVVGVDGSPSSDQAVRWAAAEAARRGSTLLLVHAWFTPSPAPYTPVSLPRSYRDAIREQGTAWLSQAAALARAVAPELPVRTELLAGLPAELLVRVSREAQLVVLGSRGPGGFTGLLVGSVAVALAARAHCPVVVVRGTENSGSGPVVVGVDGSELSDAAVTFAFDAASTREVPLVAVHAGTDTPVADERRLLSERLAGWRAKYPEVTVEERVVSDRPSRALLATGAQLIVVGSRGRGALAGLGLGSTSQAVLQHAECPVVVVRPGAP